MARFQCVKCLFDGQSTWAGELVCPRCGSTTGVRAAIGMKEMTDREADGFTALAAQLSEDSEDEE